MKLRRLPTLAILAIIIGGILLLSGSAYAAYQLLWPKPEVHVSQPITSENGRKQVTISFEQCGDKYAAQGYELKRNAPITEDQIAGVVQAHCELDTIESWANKTYQQGGQNPQDPRYTIQPKDNKPYDSQQLMTSFATHIKNQNDHSVTFVGLTKYGFTDETLDITKDTRYIADGMDTSANQITKNDPIVYVTMKTIHMTPSDECTTDHCGYSGIPTNTKLLAIVKLSLPFENYDQLAWQSLTERMACFGNEKDNCLTGYIGSIDLYNALGPINSDGGIMKEIQGVITAINGTSFTIKSSSGRHFTVNPPSDIITDYNVNRSALYNNVTIQVGSSLSIRYYEKSDEHTKTLSADSIFTIGLQLEMISKGDAPTAY